MRNSTIAHQERRRLLIACALASGVTGCAVTAPDPLRSPAVTSALAPVGRLRACINLGNPILARREAAGTAPLGVSVDGNEAAHREAVLKALPQLSRITSSFDSLESPTTS